MSLNLGLLALILGFAYVYFYLNSKQYLRREYFQVGSGNLIVSWPGGVVSPPPFGSSASLPGY
jgi:hypothetical protein